MRSIVPPLNPVQTKFSLKIYFFWVANFCDFCIAKPNAYRLCSVSPVASTSLAGDTKAILAIFSDLRRFQRFLQFKFKFKRLFNRSMRFNCFSRLSNLNLNLKTQLTYHVSQLGNITSIHSVRYSSSPISL